MPSPGPSTFKYGGNTPCVEIGTPQGHTIILDCGTGVTHLGKLLDEKTPPGAFARTRRRVLGKGPPVPWRSAYKPFRTNQWRGR